MLYAEHLHFCLCFYEIFAGAALNVWNDSNTSEEHWTVLLNCVFSRRLPNKCSPERLWFICCCSSSWVHKAQTRWFLGKVISTLQIAGLCHVGRKWHKSVEHNMFHPASQLLPQLHELWTSCGRWRGEKKKNRNRYWACRKS